MDVDLAEFAELRLFVEMFLKESRLKTCFRNKVVNPTTSAAVLDEVKQNDALKMQHSCFVLPLSDAIFIKLL